ncbi:MBL fold metallo-hydrolase [Pseudoduganella lutea]|uniref:MBL fold metallo-hydrolase n=1 Tax=Pseudoduganella lutea TaxID=321985 RepID=A0A4P6L545_9BURK|nr:MBL fold metallo-hydrolase [Pseudoduganella lutea]QBE65962.1 MBL fold metallo-hydrolase [Pseudoduganella lutea]
MTQPALTISRILHAGYVFACGGTRIAFDPIFENPFSRNCHAFPAVRFDVDGIRRQRFDAVFISHFHDDHCSFDSLDLLDRATPLYIYCLFDELFDMVRQLGFTSVTPLRLDVPVDVGAFQVVPREAMDADVDSMFQVKAAGLNVLNVVDSWIDDTTLAPLVAQGPWDMVLWPFQTMRELEVLAPSRFAAAPPSLPEEWIPQLRALAPRYVVPSSCQFQQEPWSWYNRAFFPISYARFAQEVTAALPATTVVRLDPSVSVALDAVSLQPAPPLDWVLPIGEGNVDYAYQGNAAPPPTSDIARHFAPLTAGQHARVLDFCRIGLPDKYGTVEPASEYFDEPRTWQLSVYDHAGVATHFRYRLEPGGPATPDDGVTPPGWTTEIPAARLWAALEEGESLTSMYLRINDAVFDADTDSALAQADVTDDPLIRCLFSDTFGAYQAAQLRRVLARSGSPGAQLPATDLPNPLPTHLPNK